MSDADPFKNKFIQLSIFIAYLCLINIIITIVGHLTIPTYNNWYFSKITIEDLVFIAIYAVIQIVVLPVSRIRNIILVGGIYMLLGCFLWSHNYDGYGGEVCEIYVSCISKFNHLLNVIKCSEGEYFLFIRINAIIIFPIYLICVTLLFRKIMYSIK